MKPSPHRLLCRFAFSAIVLTYCALAPQVKAQTDGANRKPNAKLWKSEKEAGEAAFKNNKMTDAESHFKAALDEAENFGPKDDRLAESLTELGDFYARMAKYAAADPRLQRAVEMRRGDPNAMTEAYVQFLLGYTRIELQHYDDAEKAFLRAQELYSRKSGPDNPLAVRCMFYLGMIYDEQHDYAKAEPLLKRSASLFEHPATRTTMHRINDPAAYAGSDVWITKYRPDYIYAVEAQARLGAVYSAQNQPSDAEASFKNSVKLLDERFAKNDPYVFPVLTGTGALLLARHNYAGAEPFFKRLVALYEKTPGPEAMPTLNAKSALAAIYGHEGKFDEAQQTYKELIATLEKTGGDNKFPLIQTLENYAGLLRKAKHDSEAAAVEDRAKKLENGAGK